MTVAISTSALTKNYQVGFVAKRKVRALDQLTLKVEAGQLVGLLGPNGAGKSTTIKILLNLIRATSGDAELFGLQPADPRARGMVGFLPENPSPYEYLTGHEFVTLQAQLCGLSGDSLVRQVGEAIERVGMERAKALQIRKYSKGMIQRISLAQALVNDPRLLILDEPTSGLDVLGRQLVRDIITDQRKRGTTVLFCSHIIPDVEALCDHVVVLINGRMVKEGSVSELLSGDKALVELTIESLSESALAPLASRLVSCEPMGGRLLIRCDEPTLNEVVKLVLAQNGRLVALQRTRYSLEELFLEAVKSSANSVGSEIS